MLRSCTAPTPSQRPMDPPSPARNDDNENSGIKYSVTSTCWFIEKLNPGAITEIKDSKLKKYLDKIDFKDANNFG